MIRVEPGGSRLLSQRHFREWCFRGPGHLTSIFLEPFAPPELPGFNATMVPLTPVECCLTPDRSLGFMNQNFRPFRLQPPDCSNDRFDTLPISVVGFRIAPIWASP